MDKQKEIKLDSKLVEIFEDKSYSITDDEVSHYCVEIDDMEISLKYDTTIDLKDISPAEILAGYLQYRGYGDVKQAQIEVLEKLKKEIEKSIKPTHNESQQMYNSALEDVILFINQLIKENCRK